MDILLNILSVVLVIIGILIILGIVCLLLSATLYESVFGRRFEIQDSLHLPDLRDYPDLEQQPEIFKSKRGYTLYGCYYYNKNITDFKGLIVFSHGIFDGHISYLPEMSYFAERGYKIFGFDNSGCHLSQGKSMRGLPQSAEDLSAALDFITVTDDIMRDKLPLYLFGHSWGGYAVSAVSCYKLYDIKAVFVQSGFNHPADMLLEEGSRIIGKWVYLLSGYVKLYQRLKYKKAADYTARQGIAAASKNGTRFMILHSTDDGTISLSHSVLANVDKNDNITFVTQKNKGHNSLDSDEAIQHKLKLDADMYAALGKNATTTQKKEYYRTHESREVYDSLDMPLMKLIYDFFETSK